MWQEKRSGQPHMVFGNFHLALLKPLPTCKETNYSKTLLSPGVIGTGKMLEINRVLEITNWHVLII